MCPIKIRSWLDHTLPIASVRLTVEKYYTRFLPTARSSYLGFLPLLQLIKIAANKCIVETLYTVGFNLAGRRQFP